MIICEWCGQELSGLPANIASEDRDATLGAHLECMSDNPQDDPRLPENA